ncbi:hypothetical protein ABXT47_00780 [Candidatus Pelagibacter sp. Uisw_099_02]|uniref:hypothetical protein n=1 Tax=Candidatus Pelagibacter sp. Uisw_099_02 TaxID=3230981 RepID=UPI0039E8C5B2
MINYLYLVFFIIFIFLSQLSILGYGKVTKKIIKLDYFSNERYFQKFIEFFLGIITLNVIGYILYILSITNIHINLLILTFGLLIYLKQRNKYSKKIEKTNIILLMLLCVGVLISKTHEDFTSNHLPFIDVISNSKLILGLSNLEIIYTYSSFLSYLQKIFVLPIINYKFLHVPIFLIFFNICLFLISEILYKKKFNFINLFLLIFLLTKFTRISEYGYDYISGFILLSIVLIYFYSNNKYIKINLSLICIFFLYAVSIKATSLFFFPVFLIIFLHSSTKYNGNFKEFFLINKNSIFFFLVLFLLIIIDNFFKSGCFFYYLKFTCLDDKIIPWAINSEKILDFSQVVELWAKGYFHQTTITNNPELFLKFSSWFPIWYKNYFNYKIFEFLIIMILITFLIIALNYKNFKLKTFNLVDMIFFLSSVFSLIFWISYLPQLRFGFYALVCFVILLVGNFTNINEEKNNNKSIYSLIIISLVIFNILNIKRINNEFQRNDKYKFNNFPFESVSNYLVKDTFDQRYLNIKTNKFYFFDYIER